VPELKVWAARALVFVLVVVAGGLAAWVVRELIWQTGLGGADRALGGLFGFARGVLIVGLVVIGMQSTGIDQDPWWQGSRLKPYTDQVAEGIRYYGAIGSAYFRDQEIA
jgi:membrane protein required for colicin V production